MNKAIDEYIRNAQPFARPILKKLRTIIHGLGTDIAETIKWGSPVYVFHGNLCMTWAFKEHAAIVFFKGAFLKDDFHVLEEADKNNVSSRSIRYTCIDDLNEDVVRNYLLQAIEINKKGLKPAVRKKPPLEIPDEFLKAIKIYKEEFVAFQKLAPSHKRNYVEYYLEAKKEETRVRRMDKILENLRKVK
ncbi:MAG: YdeI/OmpD-associated family protein [Flavobacteriales bacterium]